MLEGLARKIGLVLAGVTALSWLLFVIGFGLSSLKDFSGGPVANGSVFVPHFIISLLGVPTIVLGVIHALGTSGIARIFGSITTFFSILFLLCLGMILYINGIALVSIGNIRILNHSLNLQFAGALITTLSWTGMMMAWNFYVVPGTSSN